MIPVVIPVGAGREDNLAEVIAALERQTEQPSLVVVVRDGADAAKPPDSTLDVITHTAAKHEPGREQPRNIGVRIAKQFSTAEHVWFLDSDVVVQPDCLELILDAYAEGPPERIMVCPYDWLQFGYRPPIDELAWSKSPAVAMQDPRWAMFHASPPSKLYREDLSAGLACFSGNLVWPVQEFQRVGGFWSELHHGRCEDGELGARAVRMEVPISFCSWARGWHLAHDVNVQLTMERNARDVPMLNARHPWIQSETDVFMVDRDGKGFDVRCHGCGEQIATIGWWAHAEKCAGMEIPVG
jgi:GT2 family glycosyltransferase